MRSPSKRELRRLLILSCSARKQRVSGGVAAWDLYDGVAFRVVKRAEREKRLQGDVDVLILSALHGIIPPNQLIEHYDLRMTHEIAVRQADANCRLLREMLAGGGYSQVFLHLGRAYLTALQPVSSWLPESTDLVVPAGGIGTKNAQLRQWLDHGGPQARR